MLLSQRKARSQLKGRRQVAKTVHLKTYSGKEWEGFQRITKDSMSADRRQRLDVLVATVNFPFVATENRTL